MFFCLLLSLDLLAPMSFSSWISFTLSLEGPFFRGSPKLARKVVAKAVAATNWLGAVERDAIRSDSITYCLECGASCGDRQSLAVHVYRAHGIRRYIRAYVDGTDCLVCGVRFCSRQRLIDHLAEKSQVCSMNYLRRYNPLSPQRLAELEDLGRSDFSRRLRVEGAHGVRVHGPFLPVFDVNGVQIRTRHPLGPNRRWIG